MSLGRNPADGRRVTRTTLAQSWDPTVRHAADQPNGRRSSTRAEADARLRQLAFIAGGNDRDHARDWATVQA